MAEAVWVIVTVKLCLTTLVSMDVSVTLCATVSVSVTVSVSLPVKVAVSDAVILVVAVVVMVVVTVSGIVCPSAAQQQVLVTVVKCHGFPTYKEGIQKELKFQKCE